MMVRSKFKTKMEKQLGKLTKPQLIHLIQSVISDDDLIKMVIKNREHQKPKPPSFVEGCWECKEIAHIVLDGMFNPFIDEETK
jgi:hypothetical protein